MFLTEQTKKAFNEWVANWGATYHPEDVNRFNKFALLYCKEPQNQINKSEFVKEVKKYTKTSIRLNRGIAQKFYQRLETIKSFCESNSLIR